MRARRLSRLAGVLAVAALAGCGSAKKQEEGTRQDFVTLRDATVTLFPGHCAGVVVADGRHALTAAHCIDVPPGERQPVVLRSGRMLSGVVKVVDSLRDLAVIRFDEVAPVRPLAVATAMPLPGEGLLFFGRTDRPNEDLGTVVVMPVRRPETGREQGPILTGREGSDMRRQAICHHCRKGHRSSRPARLGNGANLGARSNLPLDPHCPPQEIDILNAQRKQLADAQTKTSLSDDHRPVPRRNRIRKTDHLRHR